ncbi:hypothetical protein BXZ70DRAFT_218343 [Cristinia sonorae]|uniref:Uncharacterized protein n=1 Tax=Cristinia sonorae TaxID=1940300 RepID=A0A8K0UM74_9AGAR|nr:hypothetical protein BXZ70DRAFT_218343 [Cristinia sonorae]
MPHPSTLLRAHVRRAEALDRVFGGLGRGRSDSSGRAVPWFLQFCGRKQVTGTCLAPGYVLSMNTDEEFSISARADDLLSLTELIPTATLLPLPTSPDTTTSFGENEPQETTVASVSSTPVPTTESTTGVTITTTHSTVISSTSSSSKVTTSTEPSTSSTLSQTHEHSETHTSTASLTTTTTPAPETSTSTAPGTTLIAQGNPTGSRILAQPTLLPHPPDLPTVNPGADVSGKNANLPDTTGALSGTSKILVGVFGAAGGLLLLLIMIICYRRYRSKHSSITLSSPLHQTRQLPSSPHGSEFSDTQTTPNGTFVFTQNHMRAPSYPHNILPSPPPPSMSPQSQTHSEMSHRSTSTSPHQTISPLLMVNTARFSAQKGRYQFDTSSQTGRDSPLDPFAYPYATIRGGKLDAAARVDLGGAESPTIRTNRTDGARQGAGAPLTTVSLYDTQSVYGGMEQDFSSVGFAAVRGGGASTSGDSVDPFATPKEYQHLGNARLSDISSFEGGGVDVVITPPSPQGHNKTLP